MDFASIEKKWSEKWENEGIFCSEPSNKEKKYISAAFPYPNSPQHIGHARTYTTADIYARYLRLKGYNVLFPMGFHVTGTPILAMAKRISAKDKDVLEVFENIYGISESEYSKLSDPKALVTHFSAEIEQGMKEIGYSIDWRRKFYSFDEKFSKFIQWQFRKLKELGYLIKGEYPIAFCPSDKQAVSAHDTKGDVDPELEEVTAIKFEIKNSNQKNSKNGKEYFIVTTYRPETIYGVTNIWINPNIEYVRVKNESDSSILIMSKESVDLLKFQLKLDEKNLLKVSIEEIQNMIAINPNQNSVIKEVPVYRASFVKGDVGTGVVMSVPAHAPKDFVALRDLGKGNIEMPQVVTNGNFRGNPAKEIVEKMGVKDQNDPKIEEATKELYLREAQGEMLLGEKDGWKTGPVTNARNGLILTMNQAGISYTIRVLTNPPVFCRCGAKVVVNMIKDQWFIDYGIEEWKNKAKECLAKMEIIPSKTRAEYEYTIDWLRRRPSTRASGLGTRFPFDETKMIEALSDSTIYMAFYTIMHLLKNEDAKNMDEKFFDFVFLGKGKGTPEMEKMRESFTYWYPVDSRHSAGDLIRNHLTVFIFNHVAIMEKKFWPKQIATNGFVLMDGAKMSKSMGNIFPLRKAIKEYGADIIRFSVVAGAEISTDTDFSRSVADGVKSRLQYISNLANKCLEIKPQAENRIDKWLLSRLDQHIKKAEKMYNNLELRELALEIFYEVVSDLEWYEKRSDGRLNLHAFFKKWLILISPFMPHIAEEYWSRFKGEGFISLAKYPVVEKVDETLNIGEQLIKNLIFDVEKVSKLINKKPQKVTIFIAANWKRKLTELAIENKNFESTMKAAATSGIPMKDAANSLKQLMKNVHSLNKPPTEETEYLAIEDAKTYLSIQLGCIIEIIKEEETKIEKAKNAMPMKPALLIE